MTPEKVTREMRPAERSVGITKNGSASEILLFTNLVPRPVKETAYPSGGHSHCRMHARDPPLHVRIVTQQSRAERATAESARSEIRPSVAAALSRTRERDLDDTRRRLRPANG